MTHGGVTSTIPHTSPRLPAPLAHITPPSTPLPQTMTLQMFLIPKSYQFDKQIITHLLHQSKESQSSGLMV
ncbi:hypothetical protein COCSADRAFT_267180 [Bipolaris sorokiniana ND90Pr]|uniref:Uncharacterized protein n=1 Tax=Cochliobolus sativus (strain ND90Pr / ATCC 201652) TaxID=665912 RepID=M2T075_COCSN|nr:uncharacterized protein COCSADRAFT_267180 [Bipolaris sorokiniana ND90Pr]EMD67965.1 hypothetical protein COCSADRAFT_267180 [Bipolaris sorokiniana ND90Pr]